MIDRLLLRLPNLPESLENLVIWHVSDLHVTRWRKRYAQLIRELADLPQPDLLALTGDYMTHQGDEPAAMNVLEQLFENIAPKIITLGVFGNHDTNEFRQQAAGLPVHWLSADRPWRQNELCVLGCDCAAGTYDSDLLETLIHCPPDAEHGFRLLLMHMPMWFTCAADAGVDLMLCGHTHGGQCRLPGRIMLHGGEGGWPLRLGTGVLAMRQARCVISRGLGESKMDHLRFLCPPHAVVITLQRDDDPPPPITEPRVIVRW